MSEKHPDTERWGGPGASREDRYGRHIQVTGGGETDLRHAHAENLKSDFEAGNAEKSKDRRH